MGYWYSHFSASVAMFPLSCWCLLALIIHVQAQVLSGVQILDGRTERIIWKTEDFPSYEFDRSHDVPKQLSFCVRYFIDWANQKSVNNDGHGLLMVWTPERDNIDGASIEFNIRTSGPKFWVMDSDTVNDYRKQKDNHNRENTLRKWNSICFSCDFEKKNQTCQMSWNGQVSEEKTVRRNRNTWGWNYGLGTPGFNFTLGKYWNGPYFIGKLVDFNAWNRTLTEEEHLMYSNCKNYSKANGNLMNSETKWNKNNNKFVVDYEVSWEEVQCSKKNSYTAAPIAERQKGFLGAEKTCNKLEPKGMLPEILTYQDYLDHYWLAKNHSAFEAEYSTTGNDQCWAGGRLHYFIPYRETDDATGFLHYYTGSKLEFPFWLDWYLGPDPTRAPVADKDRHTLCSYYGYGGEYNESYVARRLEGSTGCCIVCKIEHNYLNSTYMKLRGLCYKTKFDKYYVPRFSYNTNLLMYYGRYDTIIEYNIKESMWEMYVSYKPTVRAKSKSTYGTLALGNLQWTIYNDTECSSDGETKTLTMSICTAKQFTCDNGLCINIDLRCNGDTDCDDQSDEVGCNSISVEKSYNKENPPPPYTLVKDRELVQVNLSTTFILLQGKCIIL